MIKRKSPTYWKLKVVAFEWSTSDGVMMSKLLNKQLALIEFVLQKYPTYLVKSENIPKSPNAQHRVGKAL